LQVAVASCFPSSSSSDFIHFFARRKTSHSHQPPTYNITSSPTPYTNTSRPRPRGFLISALINGVSSWFVGVTLYPHPRPPAILYSYVTLQVTNDEGGPAGQPDALNSAASNESSEPEGGTRREPTIGGEGPTGDPHRTHTDNKVANPPAGPGGGSLLSTRRSLAGGRRPIRSSASDYNRSSDPRTCTCEAGEGGVYNYYYSFSLALSLDIYYKYIWI